MAEHPTTSLKTLGDQVWDLPPLILHPFSNQLGPSELLQGSKAALMLAGLLPAPSEDRDELTRKLLTSRYAEIRMLFFVGKDLLRWIDQCMDLVGRTEALAPLGVKDQSFASLLVYSPPKAVVAKLQKWGVANPQSVFSRAIAMASVFREVPPVEFLSDEFLMHYHNFA